uniref:Uncharacterized protein n=1 Tax=Nelumbo nucifera TaxID=4432 RepID=A0A822YAF6_NELNU|nr:TPA_asm: hypothetical protein HUJ06_030750 [Nelumbo nucifera]
MADVELKDRVERGCLQTGVFSLVAAVEKIKKQREEEREEKTKRE